MKIETVYDRPDSKLIRVYPWPDEPFTADVTVLEQRQSLSERYPVGVFVYYGRHAQTPASAREWANAILAACDIADAITERPPPAANLREALADLAHAQWSGWMRYLFDKTGRNPDGTSTIPSALVDRWQRQMMTPYADLPEHEKPSDRAEADKMIAVMRNHFNIRDI